jgi:hypothetical protein
MNNFRKNFISLIFFSTIVFTNIFAQNNIDSFLVGLHNKDVRFKIIMTQTFFDSSGHIHPFEFRRILTSLNVSDVKNAYPKYLLIQRLVQLLDDSDKDWYADILLTSLTGVQTLNQKDNLMRIDTREKWLEPAFENSNMTHKYLDIRFWQNYLFNISPSDKWKKFQRAR